MEPTIKDKLALALAKLQAGCFKLKHFKAYKIQENELEFDEFCRCSVDIFEGCDLIEEIKDKCVEGFCHD